MWRETQIAKKVLMWRRDTEREKVKDEEWLKVCVGESVWMCVREKEGKRFRERNGSKKQKKKENMKLKPASSLATECKCCTLPAKTCIQTHSHMNIKFLHCILCVQTCTPTAIWHSSLTAVSHSCEVKLGHFETVKLNKNQSHGSVLWQNTQLIFELTSQLVWLLVNLAFKKKICSL